MISEDVIMDYLNGALQGSEPGAQIHHLHVVTAPPSAIGPLGVVPDDRLQGTVYAIAPDESVSPTEFVGRVIRMAAVEAQGRGHRVVLATLAMESWMVFSSNRDADKLRAEVRAAGSVSAHPDAAEVTAVYAVCADGRRWRSHRFLSGPKAGREEGVKLLVGPVRSGESASGIVAVEGALRALVLGGPW